jgi:hypothetical protein
VNVENIIRNVRVLWRADRIIAEIQLRRLLAGAVTRAFAGLFAAFGVLMLELAAYFALVQVWTAIASAMALGVFNLALAGFILLVAGRAGKAGGDYEVAMALHNSAVENLQLQARSFETVRSSGLGIESILSAVAVPAITMLVKSLRQRKAPAE